MHHSVDFAYLNRLKDGKQLTIHDIAEQSGVAESTVKRLLSGANDSPLIINVTEVITVLGGSLDELMGVKVEPQSTKPEPYDPHAYEVALQSSRDSYNNAYNKLLATTEKQLAQAESSLRTKDIWLKRLFIYCCCITVMLTILTFTLIFLKTGVI